MDRYDAYLVRGIGIDANMKKRKTREEVKRRLKAQKKSKKVTNAAHSSKLTKKVQSGVKLPPMASISKSNVSTGKITASTSKNAASTGKSTAPANKILSQSSTKMKACPDCTFLCASSV